MTIGLIPTLVKCKLSIKVFNLLNENVVLNCIPIPQGITSCSRSIIKKLYKEVQSYQFHTSNINSTPRVQILTTKVLKEYFSVTHVTVLAHCPCCPSVGCLSPLSLAGPWWSRKNKLKNNLVTSEKRRPSKKKFGTNGGYLCTQGRS